MGVFDGVMVISGAATLEAVDEVVEDEVPEFEVDERVLVVRVVGTEDVVVNAWLLLLLEKELSVREDVVPVMVLPAPPKGFGTVKGTNPSYENSEIPGLPDSVVHAARLKLVVVVAVALHAAVVEQVDEQDCVVLPAVTHATLQSVTVLGLHEEEDDDENEDLVFDDVGLKGFEDVGLWSSFVSSTGSAVQPPAETPKT